MASIRIERKEISLPGQVSPQLGDLPGEARGIGDLLGLAGDVAGEVGARFKSARVESEKREDSVRGSQIVGEFGEQLQTITGNLGNVEDSDLVGFDEKLAALWDETSSRIGELNNPDARAQLGAQLAQHKDAIVKARQDVLKERNRRTSAEAEDVATERYSKAQSLKDIEAADKNSEFLLSNVEPGERQNAKQRVAAARRAQISNVLNLKIEQEGGAEVARQLASGELDGWVDVSQRAALAKFANERDREQLLIGADAAIDAQSELPNREKQEMFSDREWTEALDGNTRALSAISSEAETRGQKNLSPSDVLKLRNRVRTAQDTLTKARTQFLTGKDLSNGSVPGFRPIRKEHWDAVNFYYEQSPESDVSGVTALQLEAHYKDLAVKLGGLPDRAASMLQAMIGGNDPNQMELARIISRTVKSNSEFALSKALTADQQMFVSLYDRFREAGQPPDAALANARGDINANSETKKEREKAWDRVDGDKLLADTLGTQASPTQFIQAKDVAKQLYLVGGDVENSVRVAAERSQYTWGVETLSNREVIPHSPSNLLYGGDHSVVTTQIAHEMQKKMDDYKALTGNDWNINLTEYKWVTSPYSGGRYIYGFVGKDGLPVIDKITEMPLSWLPPNKGESIKELRREAELNDKLLLDVKTRVRNESTKDAELEFTKKAKEAKDKLRSLWGIDYEEVQAKEKEATRRERDFEARQRVLFKG